MEYFSFEMDHYGKGNSTHDNGIVVATTKQEALGLLLEKYQNMSASNFTISSIDATHAHAFVMSHDYSEE